MKKSTGKWTWSQINRADSEYLSVMLMKRNHSIALTFPRPKGWIGDSQADHEFVRGVLFEAAEEPWGVPPPRA